MQNKTERNKTILISQIIVALIITGGLFYYQMNKSAPPTAIEESHLHAWDQQVKFPEKQSVFLEPLKKEMPEDFTTPPSPQASSTEEIFKQAPVNVKTEDPCQTAVQQLDRFYVHLDSQIYFQEYNMEGGSKNFFQKIAKKLMANPPDVARETDNLFTILKNIAHFFRVLGGHDLQLVKAILANEDELLEQVMAHFYRWSVLNEQCLKCDYGIRLPLENMSRYAGFFLNTLGGQSYLFRRKIKIRLLTKYYCVLILDQANDQNLNQFGIDIRYPIDSLLDEMEVIRRLHNRDLYLDRLDHLKNKYERLHG